MSFNSLDFAIFLPVVFCLYWLIPGKWLQIRNVLLLVASYFFYGWWDPRFLILIAFSSLVDFWASYRMGSTTNPATRKALLVVSIVVNLGMLLFFKYYNFFAQNLADAFTLFGKNLNVRSLHIILPVGISFYTFQTMSYSIDVYRNKLKPGKDALAFFTYVSFFPQLVAGPIERATHLLPQFSQAKSFQSESIRVGIKYIIWGLFKKMVIADNCAVYVNDAFAHYSSLNASTLVIASVLFSFQVYGDFSGYSDIAIGSARLFGFHLQQNFALPFFAADIADFWRRWHISLTTWVNEYIYTPLVIRMRYWNRSGVVLSVVITFFILGLWHGANWNFILFGLMHGVAISAELLTRKYRKNLISKLPAWFSYTLGMGFTFAFFSFSLIFFRSASTAQAFGYVKGIFSLSILSDFRSVQLLPVFIVFLLVLEGLTQKQECVLLAPQAKVPFWIRYACYGFIVSLIGVFGYMGTIPFVYFQF